METEALGAASELDFSLMSLFLRATLTVKITMILLVLASGGIGYYHAGVEAGIFALSPTCAGVGEASSVDERKAELAEKLKPIRNHGLFSKAEQMLHIAGWSEGAKRDIEIFIVVDTDGLTPLLSVLNRPDARGRGAGQPRKAVRSEAGHPGTDATA